MLTVRLYKNIKKRTNSTAQPAAADLYSDESCAVKMGSSVTAPVMDFALATDPVSSGYNYAYVSSWGRYYFIRDWICNNGIWTAYMDVDVLASYKTQIGALRPYVLRSGSEYDADMPDNLYPAKHLWSSAKIPLSEGVMSWANRSYVIGIVSTPASYSASPNTMGSIRYYTGSESQIIQLIKYLMSSAFIGNFMADGSVGLTETVAKAFSDPLQYIVSLMAFPFTVITPEAAQAVKPVIGPFDTHAASGIPALYELSSLVQSDFNESALTPGYKVANSGNPYATTPQLNFLNFEPYCQYSFVCEPWGTIPLDAEIIGRQDYVYYGYDIDLVTGYGRLSLGTTLKGMQLGTYTTMVGVPVPLAQLTQDIIGGAVNTLNAVKAGALSMLAGDIGGVASSVFQGVASAASSVYPNVERQGAPGCVLSYMGENKREFVIKYTDCADISPDLLGNAVNFVPTSISAMSGYVLCAEGDHSIDALETEKERISAYMTGGFFYE